MTEEDIKTIRKYYNGETSLPPIKELARQTLEHEAVLRYRMKFDKVMLTEKEIEDMIKNVE